MGTKAKKHRGLRFLLLLGIAAALCALCVGLLGVRYETNDDAAMANIAAGAFGPDSQYLVFSNVFYGWFLKGLTALAPAAPWYGLAALALLTAALAAAGSVFLERFGPRFGAGAWALLLVFGGVDLWTSVQFTKTAAFCIAAGLLTLLDALPRRGWGGICGGAALLLCGSMIRFDLFWPLTAVAACAFAAVLLAQKSARERRQTALVFAAVLLVCCAVQWGGTALVRSDPAWDEYYTYNAARSELLDYRIYYADDAHGATDYFDAGITEAEYAMLRSWNTADTDFFTPARMEQVSALIPSPSFGAALGSYFRELGTALSRMSGLLFLLAGAAALLSAGKKDWAFPALTMAAVLGGMFLISWRGRLISRVEVALLLGAALFLTSFVRPERLRTRRKALVLGAVTLAAVAAACISLGGNVAELRYRLAADSTDTSGVAVIQADKDHLYLLESESFSGAMGTDFWHPRARDTFANIAFLGGWMTDSPFAKTAMAAYGVENPFRDCVGSDRVLLLGNIHIHEISRYIMLHYDIDSRLTETETAGIYRIEK